MKKRELLRRIEELERKVSVLETRPPLLREPVGDTPSNAWPTWPPRSRFDPTTTYSLPLSAGAVSLFDPAKATAFLNERFRSPNVIT